MNSTNYKLLFLFIAFLSIHGFCLGQKDISKALKMWNKGSIPYAYADSLPKNDSLVFLDSREKDEFDVSHLKNAMWVGYKNFDDRKFLKTVTDKAQPIIVYCSIGVRSENIGEKLKKLGYTNVQNLYGGIFEWKNEGKTVVNDQGVETDSVHAFNKHWGKLLHEGIKVY